MSAKKNKRAEDLRDYIKTLNLDPQRQAIAEEWVGRLTGPTIVTKDNEDGFDVLECLCCQESFYLDDGSWHKSKKICDDCAKALGNSWHKARSGESHPSFCSDEEREIIAQRMQLRRGYNGGKLKIPVELLWEVFERDNFTCKKCGTRRFLNADHVTPESNGGPTTIDNLQTLCFRCNSKKGRKMEVAA